MYEEGGDKMNNNIFTKSKKLIVTVTVLFALVLGLTVSTQSADAASSKLVSTAYSRLGSTYVYGAGHSMSALKNKRQRKFDCSGLVSWVYYQSGINIGVRTTSSLRSVGKRVSWKNRKKGDILLFGSHTGIYIGNNKMIHAPSTGKKIQITKISSYYRRRLTQVRRVVGVKTKKKKSYRKGRYVLKHWMYVRTKASTHSKKEGKLSKNKKIKIVSTKGSWGRFKYKGRYRYVSLTKARRV